MVKPLFPGGTPSSKVIAEQQLATLGLPDDPETQRIARVMGSLIPWNVMKVRSFGTAALEASNVLNEDVTKLVFQIAQLNIDEYLIEVAKLMSPPEQSWLGKLMLGDVKVDINPIEARLKVLVGLIDKFSDAIAAVEARSKEELDRLVSHAKAAKMAAQIVASNKEIPLDTVLQRQQLLDMAVTTATMTATQIAVNRQSLLAWRGRIEQLLYVGIPNWRSVNGAPVKNVGTKAMPVHGIDPQVELDLAFKDMNKYIDPNKDKFLPDNNRSPFPEILKPKKPYTPGGALF